MPEEQNDPGYMDVIGALSDRRKANEVLRGAIAVVVVLWCIWMFAVLTGRAEVTGLVGDSFGSLNALFSGLALAGLVYTVISQSRELEMTEEMLRLAREEAKQSGEGHRETLALQVRQAEITLAAARLDAAAGLAQIHDRITAVRSRSSNELSGFAGFRIGAEINILKQQAIYIQLVLRDIETPEFDWKGLPTGERTIARKYLAIRLRHEANLWNLDGEMGDLLSNLIEDLKLLRGQPWIPGTDDDRRIMLVLRNLEEAYEKLRDGEKLRAAELFWLAVSVADL